ncbi:MAG: hypothetical protein ABIL58_23535 [Pseudomonadota bacterium]
MKAISVRQPWAWLIADFDGAGAIPPKRLENRRTLKNIRGRFLIHAGKGFDTEGWRWLLGHKNAQTQTDTFWRSLSTAKWDAPRGGIVGVADIVGVICPGFELPAELVGQWLWRDEDQNSLILKNVSSVKFFPCPGKLSVFEVDYPYDLKG